MARRRSSVTSTCRGLLVVCVMCMITAGQTLIRADRVGHADGFPCVGAAGCVQTQTDNNEIQHHAVISRTRRQSEVVEAGEGRSHRLPCTRQEEQKVACLQGICYALDLGDLRNPFCECPAEYEGDRCELLSAYYFLNYYAQLRKGAIIGGVVIGIILIIVAASIYCSYRKGRRKRNEGKKQPDTWTTTATPKPETAAMLENGDSPV